MRRVCLPHRANIGLRRRPILQPLAPLGVDFELALAAAEIYVPFLQRLFSTGPVPPQWWLLFIVFIPLVFFAEQLRKATTRRWGNT